MQKNFIEFVKMNGETKMQYKYYEKEVMLNCEVELAATLTTPQEKDRKLPAIVIIGGSGPIDRDGNIKKMNINMYRDLAEFLSGLGFVTIRYDKRGVNKSKGDHHETGLSDLLNDVVCNIDYLKALPYVDNENIILLGHSEGCMLSEIVSIQHKISGMILIAGAGICLKTALLSQNHEIVDEISKMKGLKGFLLRLLISKEKITAKQDKLFNKFTHSKSDVIRIQFIKQPAKWFREHFTYSDYDFINMLKNTTCPVIALTGDKDVQVNSDDLKAIVELDKDNINCIIIKDMDHLLREYNGVKTLLNIKKQYKLDLSKPIHHQLKEHIKVWCVENYCKII